MSLYSFEADLLSVCLRSKKRLIKFSVSLRPKHFRNRTLRWAYEVLVDYHSKYKKLPNKDVFKNELMKTSFDADKKKQMIVTIGKLFTRKPKTSVKYLEKEIGEKIDREEFLLSLEKSIEEVENSNVDKARKNLMKRILLNQPEEGDMVRILRDWKSRQIIRKELSRIPINERFVPTPYQSINVLTKGIQKAEAATIAGMTGKGKSIVAGEFGVNSLMEGFNVTHFTLENTAEQTAQRYDSRITEIEYDTIKLYEFKGGQLKHFKDTFRALSSAMKSDVVVKELIKDESSIVGIDRIISSLEIDGFETQFLIIDSCDILGAIKNYEAYRLDRASVYWDFKFYCKAKRIPGLTTTQLKASTKWEIATSEDLAEAYDKARILDIVYIMSQTKEDYKSNIMKFIVDKNRDGPSGALINLWSDSAKMRFLEVV